MKSCGHGDGSYQFCGIWGYRNDWDAGLMHVGARYYEVETGRFVQLDRLGTGLNGYIYCSNQPTFRVDPSGHVDFPIREFLVEIANPILHEYFPEMPSPLPPWKYPPLELSPDPPFIRFPEPPYPIPAPLPFEIATGVFIVLAKWAAETFWGPPDGLRPNEGIPISPIDTLRLRRSGLTLDDLGF